MPVLRVCLPLPTIVRSSMWAGALIVLAGCTRASPGALTTANADETPPPHLRGTVDGARVPGGTARKPKLIDPAIESEVSLSSILAFADARSPILMVARSKRSRAEAARVAASVTLLTNPELSITAGPRFGSGRTGIDFDVSLLQQFQIAGERGLRRDAADAFKDLTDAEIERMRWDIHCEVHAAFHRSLIAQARTKLAKRVLEFQREVLQVVERQIAAGEAAPLAQRLAQAEASQASQLLIAAEQSFLASRIRLARLAGWPVATPPIPVGGFDSPRPPPSLARLTEVARRELPELRVDASRVREARARSMLADREAWPRPSVGLQYRHEGTAEPSDILMGVISVPIASAQLNQGERAKARADVVVAEAEFKASQRLLDGQLAEARSEVVASAARARAYAKDILPHFEENLSLLRRSFELGEIGLLELSTGRERFQRMQSEALDAQEDYFVALAGLERIVGVDLWHDKHIESNP